MKIPAVSMLTFGLFFNVGMDFEIGKYVIPTFNSITFGNVVFGNDDLPPPQSEDGGPRIVED